MPFILVVGHVAGSDGADEVYALASSDEFLAEFLAVAVGAAAVNVAEGDGVAEGKDTQGCCGSCDLSRRERSAKG